MGGKILGSPSNVLELFCGLPAGGMPLKLRDFRYLACSHRVSKSTSENTFIATTDDGERR